jgi:hypothetical protein
MRSLAPIPLQVDASRDTYESCTRYISCIINNNFNACKKKKLHKKQCSWEIREQ